MRRRALGARAVLPAFGALALAGCVQRSLVIRTDPPGARVFVNGAEKGPSPVTVPYVHPGRMSVRVEKEGFESLATEVTTPSTPDTLPVLDFFAENVRLSRVNRETVVDYRLTPLRRTSYTESELREMLRAAEAFRARAASEAQEPAPPRASGR
jgi:hypothetical protein